MKLSDEEIRKPFKEFAGQNGAYYADKFWKIQNATLPRFHINWAAAIGSFFWASLRANWLLFWIAFIIDLVAMVYAGAAYKYKTAIASVQVEIAEFAAAGNDTAVANKQFLIDRYEGWITSSLIMAIVIFIVGRLLFGWLADRMYYRQYNGWRVDHTRASGAQVSRWISLAVIVALIVPLMLYRSTQFAPSARDCVKQNRAIEAGEAVSGKAKFDCAIISEFPTLVWIDRPDAISFPRAEDGSRYVERTPPREGAKPINLHTYTSQKIETVIGYMTAFYGSFFDSITNSLRSLLGALTAIFAGTPWPISMGVLIAIAYYFAGVRVTIFVGASLAYLALFGFWQTAMDTLSLISAATLISVLVGLPLGIWIGKSARASSIITPILDMMQTIPSFVYLLPAVAFFGIGKPPGILATVIFAMPPMVRLTALGIHHVPESTKEAALAFGANPRQLLTKVELPLAMPSIMAGVNQVVMMSLSMVVVAGIIGAGGMGQLVTDALANTKTGQGVLAGVGIALLAMMIDRVVQKANKGMS